MWYEIDFVRMLNLEDVSRIESDDYHYCVDNLNKKTEALYLIKFYFRKYKGAQDSITRTFKSEKLRDEEYKKLKNKLCNK
jgi:hypothetical protein